MTSKYNNKKAVADGYTFDSQAEYRRYQALRLLEQAGTIRDLRVHPSFTLLEAFKDQRGRTHQGITYEADFQYLEQCKDGLWVCWVVEDVKGMQTEAFRIKAKWFRSEFWWVELRIVSSRDV